MEDNNINTETTNGTTTEELSDVLLVFNKPERRIEAVTGIDKAGKLQTVPAKKEHESQFMRVDRNGDPFSNFFSNFFRTLKNPTDFSFFKIPAPVVVETAKKMQHHIDTLTEEGKKIMQQYEVQQENKQDLKNINKQEMENSPTTETNEYRYSVDQIDWSTLSNLGLNKERLEKLNLLDPLLRGFKTNELVPVSINLGTVITKLDARLSLRENNDGKVALVIHSIRKEPDLKYSFFGHEFSQEDKDNLRNTGNMGRVVNLTNPKTNEIIPSIISVDKLTNELIALHTDKIKIPDQIKGVTLSEQQKNILSEGKSLFIEGMISKKDTLFSANVQFNADKRYVEFLFDRNESNQLSQSNQQNPSQDVPKTFRGVTLTDDQHTKLNEGQKVFISGLKDKQGKEYQGYITYNKETGRTDFSFPTNKEKQQAEPGAAYTTQTAVNSQGKTNETTKNIKEPLKSSQQNPDNKKQQQTQKAKAPAKSKGRKL